MGHRVVNKKTNRLDFYLRNTMAHDVCDFVKAILF